MIPEREQHEFESSSDVMEKTSTFKIAATSNMFHLLADDMYSDKIGAIIRELCCNAWDSHKAIGTDREFEVGLPSSNNPEFYVKDFGPGLDENGIEIFTTFGESTKTRSNDAIGAFGIGAKSPFAYTKSFCVESVNGGRRRVYTMYENSEGSPAKTKVYDEESSDPTGLRISFSVEEKDFYEFKNKAVKQLTHMASCVSFPEWPSVQESLHGASEAFKWKELASKPNIFHHDIQFHADYYSQLTVVMANVEYHLTNDELKEYFVKDDELGLLKISGFIKVPNGTLSPHPSRERLSFSEKTKETLQGIIEDLYEELLFSGVRDRLSEITSYTGILELINDYQGVKAEVLKKIPLIRNFQVDGITGTFKDWLAASVHPLVMSTKDNGRFVFEKGCTFSVNHFRMGKEVLFIRDVPTVTSVTGIPMGDRRKATYHAKKNGFDSIVLTTRDLFVKKIFTEEEYNALPTFESLYKPTQQEYCQAFGIAPNSTRGFQSEGYTADYRIFFVTPNGTADSTRYKVSIDNFKERTKDGKVVIAPKSYSRTTIFGKSMSFSDGAWDVESRHYFGTEVIKKAFELHKEVYVLFANPADRAMLKKKGVDGEDIEVFLNSVYDKMREDADSQVQGLYHTYLDPSYNWFLQAFREKIPTHDGIRELLKDTEEYKIATSGFTKKQAAYFSSLKTMFNGNPVFAKKFEGFEFPVEMDERVFKRRILTKWPLLSVLGSADGDEGVLDELYIYMLAKENRKKIKEEESTELKAVNS